MSNPIDHSEEDEITKLLVGFANDLLAYENRMERAGSDTLFIHDYVARRKGRFDAFITADRTRLKRELLERVGDNEEDDSRPQEIRNMMRDDFRATIEAVFGGGE